MFTRNIVTIKSEGNIWLDKICGVIYITLCYCKVFYIFKKNVKTPGRIFRKGMEETRPKPKKESRKTRYTRQVIRDSLMELMEKQPITDITIKEICTRADISRPTFYAHYRDQYNLLKSIEDEISVYFEEFVFINETGIYSKREIKQKIEEVLQYIENNSNSIQVLLSENGDIGFQKKFFFRYTQYIQHMAKNYTEQETVPGISEMYSIFTVQGLAAMVQHWLKNNMNPPIKKLAAMITELIWTYGRIDPAAGFCEKKAVNLSSGNKPPRPEGRGIV
jgi:AcrR family transcriptional regulator